ncbi:hypothetical protein MBLNU230_g0122t1 [Neophaeotheca triangularis]
MGKTPKVKKREVSIHSRAARKGADPSSDVAVKPPAQETDYKPWLHNAQNAGVGKKKKGKQESSQQKLRRQRAMEKADANVDKLEKKVLDSKRRAGKVFARRAAWEDLNEEAGVASSKDGVHKDEVVTEEGEGDEPEKDVKAMEDVEVRDATMPVPERQIQAAVGASKEAAEPKVDDDFEVAT